MDKQERDELIDHIRRLRSACEVALNANRRMWGTPSGNRTATAQLQRLLESALRSTEQFQ